MNHASGGGGELRAVITVKRAETGKVEEYELVGHATEEQVEQLKEMQNGNAQHSSTERGN